MRGMRKTTRRHRMMLRLSESLVAELKAAAEQQNRPVAEYTRQVLVDVVTSAAMVRQHQERTKDV
jgi:predicted HicB family RNase H-like nuclease